jgi:Uma2 family endonuclease
MRTKYYTLEQYLNYEREADERNEFIDGEIYAMAGESGADADISTNLTTALAFSFAERIVAGELKTRKSEAARSKSISAGE